MVARKHDLLSQNMAKLANLDMDHPPGYCPKVFI